MNTLIFKVSDAYMPFKIYILLKVFCIALLLVTLAMFSSSALAQNAIENISATKSGNGTTLVKISLHEALTTKPSVIAYFSPPKIVIDFPATRNVMTKSLEDLGNTDVKSVSILQSESRTRVVVTLSRMLRHEVKMQDKHLLLTLTQSDQAESALASEITLPAAQLSASQDKALPYYLRDIDFRRGKDGEARIIIETAQPGVSFDLKTHGKLLIVDLFQTALPRNLERKLDASDFATPVMVVDSFQHGKNARIAVEPRGLWEHIAYQSDNLIVIEVRQIAETENKFTPGLGGEYKGDKLSLNFQDVSVRAVLQVIGDFTGLNIVVNDTVTGNLTLRLRDVPWDQALDLVMQARGLDMRKNGSVLYIAPKAEIATKEKLELERKLQMTELEPLRTELFQLNYQKAEAIQKMLVTGNATTGTGAAVATAQGILSKRGSAIVDARTNILMIQDIAAKLDEIRKLLVKLDIPIKQVMIETRIVIADDRFSRQLGARFGQQTALRLSNNVMMGSSGTTGEITSVSNGTAAISSGALPIAAGVPPWQQLVQSAAGIMNVNLPVASAAGQLALTFLNLGSGNMVNLELSAMEANNRGKVVSNPRLVTSDNQRAVIEQGTEVPYITPGSGNANIPAVAFKKAVLSLTVTPQITPDNRIIMALDVKKDSVGATLTIAGGTSIPSIDTKTLSTQISVNNGETAVIGGIYEEVTRADVTKVPLLGDIPFIGALFRNTTKQELKTELLIFITPRVLTDTIHQTPH